jgi:pyridoxamine 5'-phosphate oxidase
MRAPDPDYATLDEVLAHAWAMLTRGVNDRRHGFHHLTAATVALDGRPKARVVILRAVDPAARSIRFHTDSRSAKINELRVNPLISLNFYSETDRLQIRAEGRAVLHAQDETARAAWNASQRMSRKCYATKPPSGAALAERDGFRLPESDDEIEGGYANFVAVDVKIERLEWLFLRHEGHRRAAFDCVTGDGCWLAP